MRLTSFTDYGLRLLMRLAGEPERAFTTEEMAAFFGLSRNHLTKIVSCLAAAHILRTRRGAGGGLTLERPPQQLSLGQLARVLEGAPALVDCFRSDGGSCLLRGDCRLKGRLRDAADAFLRELDRSTLADCAWPARAPVAA